MHECETRKGMMVDVLSDSDNNIYCKACWKELKEDEVDEKMWKKIKGRKRR